MPVAAPLPASGAVAPGGSFFALVTSVHTGMFSSKVNCLFVETLSGGVVAQGSRLEVVTRTARVVDVVGKRLRDGIGTVVLDLGEPQPDKGDVGDAVVVRSPGLSAPPLPTDGGPGLERLLVAVRAARAQGFPPEWSQPIKPIAGLTPEQLSANLSGLSDEADVLLIQKRVRDSLAHHDNPFAIIGDVERAAMHLAAVGLREDADRLLLTGSAIVQGHKAGPMLRAAASAGSMGVLASEVSTASLDLGQRIGWAIGIEMGDVFAKQFQSNVAVGGEVIEDALLAAGRAVAVGRCKKCHDVVQFTYGLSGITKSRELKCPTDHHKADEPVFVVPADVSDAMAALRAQPR